MILASGSLDETLIAELIAGCRAQQVKLSVVPPARGMFGTAVRLNHVADLPVVEYNTWDVSRSTLLLKRSLDVALSLAGLVLLAPLLLAAALAVRLDSRGPALFRQTRTGEGGRTFRMRKFRTMMAGRGGGAPGARRTRSARGSRCSSSATTRASRVSGGSCGARASTSCRSS